MPVRTAHAEWNGNLQQGNGTMKFGGGAFEGQYSFSSRFEEGNGTNPEELIAAAHAGCFSMALSANLAKGGYEPEHVSTDSKVFLNKGESGFSIERILLTTNVRASGIEQEQFQEIVEQTKEGCPVSRALKGVQIDVEATLA